MFNSQKEEIIPGIRVWLRGDDEDWAVNNREAPELDSLLTKLNEKEYRFIKIGDGIFCLNDIVSIMYE